MAEKRGRKLNFCVSGINCMRLFLRGNFKTIAQAAKRRLRGRRAGPKACNHTLRPREEAIAERREADWDESFEIASKD